MFDQFDILALGAVLEVGCGAGNLWRENGERIPPGWKITLGDLSPGMLADARGNLFGLDHPMRFEEVDAQDLPFEDGTYDVVIANPHAPPRA